MPMPPVPLAPLKTNFDWSGEADWGDLVKRSTQGRTVEELASASDDGIIVKPLYMPDIASKIVARGKPGAWQVVQRVDLPEISGALRQMAEDIAGGAGAVELVFAGSPLARGAGLSPARTAE